MLDTIKSLIKEKKTFNEAADLLLEDTELDDSLILISEGPDELELPEKEEGNEEESKEGDASTEEPKEDTPEDGAEPPAEGKPAPAENPEGGETLPEPIGAQTGEPAQLGDSDLLSMDIDLQSNTPKDILPTPPAGAADVVPEGDAQKVDSGFGTADVAEPEDSRDPVPEDEATDLLDLPIDEEVEIPDPNGVAKKEEKGEEKKREAATPTEKTDEFKEAKDLLDEEIDDEPEKKESAEEETKEECGDPAPAAPTEESKEEEPKEESKDPESKTEETETKTTPKTENKEEKPKVIFDKIGDVNGMTPDQIKNAMLPGFKAKLESAGILDKFVEAISIGDDGGDAAADTDSTDTPAEEPAADTAQTDNVVTAAVKDKLGEMNASDGETNAASSKEAILKKLANLSKALEDTKTLVIDSSK